jgi:hypothetical protein
MPLASTLHNLDHGVARISKEIKNTEDRLERSHDRTRLPHPTFSQEHEELIVTTWLQWINEDKVT